MSYHSDAPDFHKEFLLQAISVLQRTVGVDPETADSVARELLNELVSAFAGQLVYIAKGKSVEIAARDLQIWRDYNGHNHVELAHKYKLTTQYIYRIVERMRRLDRRQLDFFS